MMSRPTRFENAASLMSAILRKITVYKDDNDTIFVTQIRNFAVFSAGFYV